MPSYFKSNVLKTLQYLVSCVHVSGLRIGFFYVLRIRTPFDLRIGTYWRLISSRIGEYVSATYRYATYCVLRITTATEKGHLRRLWAKGGGEEADPLGDGSPWGHTKLFFVAVSDCNCKRKV